MSAHRHIRGGSQWLYPVCDYYVCQVCGKRSWTAWWPWWKNREGKQ